jgi:hypothetical protein
MLSLDQALTLQSQLPPSSHQATSAELFLAFLNFMTTDFNPEIHYFDVPGGRIACKDELFSEEVSSRRQIVNMRTDKCNDPRRHPFYIVDPFDLNHNPGKQVTFEGIEKGGKTLYREYQEFFREMIRMGDVGDLLRAETLDLLR